MHQQGAAGHHLCHVEAAELGLGGPPALDHLQLAVIYEVVVITLKALPLGLGSLARSSLLLLKVNLASCRGFGTHKPSGFRNVWQGRA
jgi:hypothetical protein